jgi:hypothetical protein
VSRKRIKRRPLGRAPSADEFNALVDAEFGFLADENGFEKRRIADNPLSIAFHRGRCVIAIVGESHGQSASMRIAIDGEDFPWYLVAATLAERYTTTTDSRAAACRIGSGGWVATRRLTAHPTSVIVW